MKRPSDGATSEALPFEYIPLDTGRRSIYALRKGLQLKNNVEHLGRVLSLNQTLSDLTTKNNGEILDETNTIESVDKSSPSDGTTILQVSSHGNLNSENKTVNETALADVGSVNSQEKTSEWLNKTEFVLIADANASDDDVQIVSPTPASDISIEENKTITVKSDNSNDEDKTLNELLEQVAELDEIYSGYQITRHTEVIARKFTNSRSDKNSFDDQFDDAATYTSLQRAFKNPVAITDVCPPSPINIDMIDDDDKYDAVEPLTNPVAPFIAISPLKRENLFVEEEKLPPLPPKRLRKITAENTEYNAQIKDMDTDSTNSASDQPLSKIIIKRTPDQNRSPVPFNSNSNSTNSSPQKKQGFFSRLFRRKSKSDINSNCTTETKNTPDISREPSITNIDMYDRNRLSTRSFRSPQSPSKRAKPVGRSVSSVSGKRPHLTADIIHIPLKGLSSDSLPMRSGSGNLIPDQYASRVTLSNNLDRKTVSALQLADLPIQDGNMELIAIADAQSLKNLCEGKYGVHLDDDVDLTEAEHFALYTSVAPYATASEFDEASAFYAPVDGGEILSNNEIAKRLAAGGQMDK